MTASWPRISFRSRGPLFASRRAMTSRWSFFLLRNAAARRGWRSASVTRFTSGRCRRSYAQAEPCRPAPSTSRRIAATPPKCSMGDETAGKQVDSPPGAGLDDESRKTEREFRLALERIVAEGKAQGSVRAGAVEIWAGVWLATVSHALTKVVAGDWKPGDTGVRLVIDAAWKAISA